MGRVSLTTRIGLVVLALRTQVLENLI